MCAGTASQMSRPDKYTSSMQERKAPLLQELARRELELWLLEKPSFRRGRHARHKAGTSHALSATRSNRTPLLHIARALPNNHWFAMTDCWR
jgi:hypothetical protein